MLDREERIILEALRRALAQELGLCREQLAQAERKRGALINNDIADLEVLIHEEKEHNQRCQEQRRIREDLLLRLAQLRRCSPQSLRMEQLLEGSSEPLRSGLRKVGEELRNVLAALSKVHEANQVLLRTSLSLVREMLSAVTGSEGREDYDRSGSQGEHRGSGGLMNLRA